MICLSAITEECEMSEQAQTHSASLLSMGLALQAASIPMHARNVKREVSGHELFHDVFLEAIEQGLFVFTNDVRTVIAREAPFGPGWVKVDSAFIISQVSA